MKQQKNLDINRMKARDFWRLPEWAPPIPSPVFTSLVILPARTDHLGWLRYLVRRWLASKWPLTFRYPSAGKVGHLEGCGWRKHWIVLADSMCRPLVRRWMLDVWDLPRMSDLEVLSKPGSRGEDWRVDVLGASGLVRLIAPEPLVMNAGPSGIAFFLATDPRQAGGFANFQKVDSTDPDTGFLAGTWLGTSGSFTGEEGQERRKQLEDKYDKWLKGE